MSHYVGMSVHDVGGMDPFEPGVAITVEPGIYIAEKALGIRIEDTVLVTRDGCDLLTAAAPRDIPSLQNLMGSDQRKLNKIYNLPGN